jgi:hypothetical protein
MCGIEWDLADRHRVGNPMDNISNPVGVKRMNHHINYIFNPKGLHIFAAGWILPPAAIAQNVKPYGQ